MISSRVTVATPIFFDLQTAGDVGQADGRVVVGAGRQGHAEDGHHHVAGAGDVVDLARPRREDLPAAVGVGQRHAFLVERDDGRLQVELLAQLGRAFQGGRRDRSARGRWPGRLPDGWA